MAQTISATDTEVQKPVNVIYQEILLRNARPRAPYFTGTQAGVLQENAGTATVAWRRYNTSADNASGIAPTTSALTELTTTASYMQGRDSTAVHFSAVTATVSKYGQFFILNEEVDLFLPNGTMAGIARTLGISAGRSLNYLQRNIAEDNATLVYAGSAASDAAVVDKIKLGAIASVVNTLNRNSAMDFMPQTSGSTNVGTAPILNGYWGICHTDVAYDITKLAGFKSVETYSGQTQTANGEFGAIQTGGSSVRFIQTPEASIDADAGGTKGTTGLRGTSDVDLYTVVIYGMEALGSLGLGRAHGDGIYNAGDSLGAIEMIAKGRGSGGTSDPFNEISTLAWKAFHGGAVLNANWLRGIRCGATNISSLA